MEVGYDDWKQCVDAVRERTDERIPEYVCLASYGIDPISVASQLSLELLELYSACGGLSRVGLPKEFYDLPALYVDACHIIDDELRRINEQKREA